VGSDQRKRATAELELRARGCVADDDRACDQRHRQRVHHNALLRELRVAFAAERRRDNVQLDVHIFRLELQAGIVLDGKLGGAMF
jgi:hypothetical protein